MTTAIRTATPADAAAIARIHSASRAATMPYLPPRKRTDAQVERWVEEVVLVQAQVWVADRDGLILGYAALEAPHPGGPDGLAHLAHLDQLYLLPEVRRQGVGTLLLAEARRAAPDGLTLFVFEANTGARAFYERHGFTPADRSDGSRNMEGLPDLTYRWTPGHSVTNGTHTAQ